MKHYTRIGGTSKLLGVPKLERSTGKEMSNAVMTHLVAWESDKTVIGMCYDTTAANTGRKLGAATLLENALVVIFCGSDADST